MRDHRFPHQIGDFGYAILRQTMRLPCLGTRGRSRKLLHWPRVLRKATGSTDKLELPRATRQDVWWLELRVSSLVRFYKSRFWFFSENFLKNSESNFWKNSEKIVNPEIFCCQPFKNEWKLVVLLLFSSCFAAIFKLVALLFSNFDEYFQKFFRIFSEPSNL